MNELMSQWIGDGRGQVIPAAMSEEFDRYLNTLPWIGSGLDWDRIPSAASINVSSASESAMHAWLTGTRIGKRKYMAVWLSASKRGIIAATGVAFDCLDELYRGSPGVRFAFGIDIIDSILVPHYPDFLQYGRGDYYYATT